MEQRDISPELRAFAALGDDIKKIILDEIKADKESRKLEAKRDQYIKAGRREDARKMEAKIQQRVEFFITIWMRRWAKTKLSVRDGLTLIEDEEERDTYLWRLCLSFFLADFLEDIYMEMENTIRKYYPGESLSQLQDFIQLKTKVRAYMSDALREETTESMEFFDENAASIKMFFHNKARGYMNALIQKNAEMQAKEQFSQQQLSFDF